jgi:type-F conjugative transfer system pilin assembly protein TrbC
MKRLLLGLMLTLAPVISNAAGETESLEKSLRPLMEQAETVEVAIPEIDPEAQKAADDLFRIYQSESFQKRLQHERQRLAEEFFGAKGMAAGNPKGENPGDAGSPATGDRIYLFVSSSVPLPTLRNYVADMARLSDSRFVMVLRGFVGGAKRIGPTSSFIADVLKADPLCELGPDGECAMREIPFIVDPTLFMQAGIEKVPAIVFAPDGNVNGRSLIVYGDASLGYGLELLARETRNKDLRQLAETLKPIP